MAEEKKPGLLQQLRESAAQTKAGRAAIKVKDVARAVSNSTGAAPLHAMVRQGADEIAQVLAAFPDSNVRPVAESGQLFEPTQQLVTEQLTGKKVDLRTDRIAGTGPGKMTPEQLRDYAAAKAQEATHQMDHQNDHQRQRGGMEM